MIRPSYPADKMIPVEAVAFGDPNPAQRSCAKRTHSRKSRRHRGRMLRRIVDSYSE